MTSLIHDLRHAVRALRRRPGFSAVVVATMAVGIGAAVAMFAYLGYFLWSTVQAPRPERLVWIEQQDEQGDAGGLSYPDVVDLDAELGRDDAVSQLAAFRLFGASVKGPERTVYAFGHAVSGDYFALFGRTPLHGRFLGPEDDRPGATPAMVLNHFLWQRDFGADPGVVGRTVELDGHTAYTVVGVARPGFQGQGVATGIYVPLATAGWLPGRDDRDLGRFFVMARLADGVGLERLRGRLGAAARGLDQAFPRDEPRRLVAWNQVERDRRNYEGEPLVDGARVLTVTVGLLLLLACANVANLMLAHATARRREMAVHAALGAGRRRLGRRLLIEALLLSSAGGGLGLLVARRILDGIEGYLLRSVPVGMGDWGLGTSLVVDTGPLTVFTVAVVVVTGVLFGLAPMLQVARLDLASALADGTAGAGQGRGSLLRRGLVVAQVALAVVLLTAAGLLVRTLWQARGVDPGFEVDGRYLATLHVPADAAGGDPLALYRGLVDEVRSLSGVRAAGLAQRIPASWAAPVEPTLGATGEVEEATHNVVSEGYFRTLGIPVLQGRAFERRDGPDAPGVVVVNRAAAEQLWPGRSPVGETVRLDGEDRAFEVVGVVADSLYARPTEPFGPHVYFAFEQRFRPRMTIVAWSDAPLAGPLHDLLRARHPDLAVLDLQPLSEQVRRAVVDQRMNADFAGGFGLLGLLLAAFGVFSVVTYGLARRVRELGIRQALGADRLDLWRLLLGETARLLALGVGLGLLASWWAARLLRGLLYGVPGHDPLTFAAVPAVLVLVGLLAAALPVVRAVRTAPSAALREE